MVLDVFEASCQSSFTSSNVLATFRWNTTGVPYGNYTVTAYASPVPYETDISDDTYTDVWVLVAVVGDVDLNGYIDVLDTLRLLIIRTLGAH